jgi:hypothetical protein
LDDKAGGMSGFITTPNYNLRKPTVGADNDLWGGDWNTNADIIDTQIKARADAIAGMLPLTGGTLTGPLTLPTLTTTGNPTNLGNSGAANYIQISGGTTNPTIGVAGAGSNGAMLLRSQGIGAINLGSPTTGNVLQIVPQGSANPGENFQLLQPAAAGSPFAFQSTLNSMVGSGGLSLKNIAVTLDQILVYSGTIAKRQNIGLGVYQQVSGISTNIGSAYPFNWFLTTLSNFQTGEGIFGNNFTVRTGAGAAVRTIQAVQASTSHMTQPLRATDAALIWHPNTAYATAGTVIVNDGGLWMLVTPGTSAATGTGPHATAALMSTNVTDGTCVWNLEDNNWNLSNQVAFASTATGNFNLGGTATNPVGQFWGAVIGSGYLGAAAGYLSANTVVELDDFVRTPVRLAVGMQVVKMGQSGYQNDWGVVINGSFNGSQGYWNPFIVMQGIMPGGTAFSTEDQWQGLVSHAAGGLDMNSLLPDGVGPGGGGYYVRWGGLASGGASGHIDGAGNVKLGFGAVRPTATGLTIDAGRWKFTGFSAINAAGSGWVSGQSAKDQNGNIVTVTVDGSGAVTALASIVTAGYLDAVPSGPQTFYPMVTGSTVGPFLGVPPLTSNIRPIIVPFTAALTYVQSTDRNITLGAAGDAVRVLGTLALSGPLTVPALTVPGVSTLGAVAISGDLVSAGAQADQSADVVAMTFGGSHTIVNGSSWVCLTAGATISLFTLTMPAAPLDGHDLWISTGPTVTKFVLLPNSGQSISEAPGSLLANSTVHYRYRAASTSWLRLSKPARANYQPLYLATTSVGNVGVIAQEDTLQAYTLPANTISAPGDQIIIEAAGTLAGNTDNKVLRVKVGAINLTPLTATAAGATSWWYRAVLTRTTTNNFRSVITYMMTNQSVGPITGAPTTNETVDSLIVVTGQNNTSAAAGSITCSYLSVTFIPAAT